MKNNVLINIKGVQTIDNQKDTTELFTTGDIYFKNNKTYITYLESEVTGYENCRTTLKIDGSNRMTLMRSGKTRSQKHRRLRHSVRSAGGWHQRQQY